MTVLELAKMIDHSLLHPTMTDADLEAGCALAAKYHVASVCIKPYYVRQATEILDGTGVLVCSVVGFPHGSSNPDIKVQETLQACEDGATEIDMVVNIGKALSKDWDFIENEIALVCEAAHSYGAIVKVIFENDFMPDDSHKIALCECCNRAGADFVKTSTGYGFVKGADGKYSYTGATEHDLRLMRQYADAHIEVKAAGGVRTLDELLFVRSLGVTRIGATTTAAILEAAKERFEGVKAASVMPSTIGY
jgi:deoxyribose-phosphate aldolase